MNAIDPLCSTRDFRSLLFDLKALMQEEHGCDVDRITFVSFTNAEGEEQIFATVDCKNTRSFSVQRVGDNPFIVRK